ncbi:hypothetical protein Q8791_17785 [Nocardiopsis sp. CT-R113]|uniref:Uncharacterized protein n=1 Tax=Nocardiopsis codii TaxID=3065942 RepID=A0ABU7KAN0_9ACTN|nr:hypothetical protein [Nocardiopsis sp. CT-R113]MEE2039067.1 hypothetical protein [Nocardiopsis sp. CT-R113]
MSRTDKTKPIWVRCAEHNPRPVHDHRHGVCDLPPGPAREDTGTRCRWEPGVGQTCCVGPNGRAAKREMGDANRAENRKSRHAARRVLRRRAAQDGRD